MFGYETLSSDLPFTCMLVTCSPDPGLSPPPPPHSMPAGMAEVESSFMSDTPSTLSTSFVSDV